MLGDDDTLLDDVADEATETAADAPEKRAPGRAKGLPKVPGSGRRAGVRNHVSSDAKEDVREVLDRNAGLLFQRLFSIALGRKIKIGNAGPSAAYIYPSEASQMRALEILARKLRPDLTATQISGDNEQPLIPRADTVLDLKGTAAAMLSLFREAGLRAPSAPAALSVIDDKQGHKASGAPDS